VSSLNRRFRCTSDSNSRSSSDRQLAFGMTGARLGSPRNRSLRNAAPAFYPIFLTFAVIQLHG
jgi:hypothetical protein